MTWAHWLLIACWLATLLSLGSRTEIYKWAVVGTLSLTCVLSFCGYLG